VDAGAAQRRPRRRRHRLAPAAGLAAALALTAAGCGSAAGGTGSAGTGAPLVTGEQVLTACYQDYFYNGILPKAAAQANCTACVVGRMRKLGIRPSAGENVSDMLTGDRLDASEIQSLQNTCRESDASSQ